MDIEGTLLVNIEEEVTRCYLDYAMSVIIGRAIPDIRDGLKPVQRRIVYAMFDMGNTSNKPYKKSARVVGDVIGKYHPHGDTAVYDAIVRLAQDFNMRYPLVDGQGNFGSTDGDPPAAMRYTEIRLAEIADELLRDIDKETVRFLPNYDGSATEPEVLPSTIPNLLINGGSGIAVGMATNIPPHNLAEVADALTLLLDKEDVTLQELLGAMPGPDFPTGGVIVGKGGITSAYLTGKGVIKLRGRAFIERPKATQKSNIVITELPYQVNKAKLIEKIGDLVRNKVIEGVEEIRDESDRDGTRVVITLRKMDAEKSVLNKLFKHTQLEVNYGIIFLAIDNGMPKVFCLKEILEKFIDFRREVVLRRTTFELARALERSHLLEGMKTALEKLDLVLSLIRKAETPLDARAMLMKEVSLTEKQAQAILDMRLQRLTRLEKENLLREYAELMDKIEDYKEILDSPARVKEIIRGEMVQIKERYGEDRRTEIVEELGEINEEDLILEESVVVAITHRGYVKRTPLSVYKTQRRGGKGKVGISVDEEDFVEHLFVSSTHAYFLIFTDVGKVYWLRVHAIPEASRIARGRPIVNLLPLQEKETVTTILPVKDFASGMFICMATRGGLIKKTHIGAFSHPRANGILSITLDKEDSLISCVLTSGNDKLFLATRNGMSLLMDERDIRPMGRNARGVKAIRLRGEDRLIAMNSVQTEGMVLTLTEKGYAKRTPVGSYRTQRRGGVGLTNVRISEKNGKVINALHVGKTDSVMIITNLGKLIRIHSSEIKVVGRNAIGVKAIDLGENETAVAAQKVVESD
ncbi:MAG: DNA gyrase subunit A [Thermodesulfobacteriota bacterium]